VIRIPASVASILLIAFWSTAALAQPAADRDFWWHPGWGYGHMFFGGLMMIAFWGGIILLIVLLVRWLAVTDRGSRSGVPTRYTPLEILQELFAKGEIDKQEYEERRKPLRE
jgi:putative membrane protein